MKLESLLGKFRTITAPKLIIYGNCDSCVVEFKGEMRAYQNLHDAERVVRDFGLAGKEIVLRTGEIEYEGHKYHPMRHIHLSNFRGWLQRRGVKAGH